MINHVNIVTVTSLAGQAPQRAPQTTGARWGKETLCREVGSQRLSQCFSSLNGRSSKCTSFLVKMPDCICRRLTARQFASQRSDDMSHFRPLAASSFSNLLPLVLRKKKKKATSVWRAFEPKRPFINIK